MQKLRHWQNLQMVAHTPCVLADMPGCVLHAVLPLDHVSLCRWERVREDCTTFVCSPRVFQFGTSLDCLVVCKTCRQTTQVLRSTSQVMHRQVT